MDEQPVVGIEPRDEMIIAAIHRARLDYDETSQMKAAVAAAGSERRPQPVVLDMSELEFIASETLGALVELHRDFRPYQQPFVLAGVHPRIREVLAVTQLDKVFELSDSVDAALARLRGD